MSNGLILHTLTDWRRIRYLKQKELADKLGVTNNTVSNWENGYKRPSPEHLKALTEVLRIEPEQIIWPQKGEENPAA